MTKNLIKPLIIIALAFILLALIFFIYIYQGDNSGISGRTNGGSQLNWATIRIKDQPWSGWSEINPPPLEKEFLVQTGQVIDLSNLIIISADQMNAPYSYLKIVTVRADSVSVEAVNLLQSVNGGMDLTRQSVNEKYEIRIGSTLELGTPTMDAGHIYSIAFVSAQ